MVSESITRLKDFVRRGRMAQIDVDAVIKKAVVESARKAGRARMAKLTPKQRREFARKGGLASAKKRRGGR